MPKADLVRGIDLATPTATFTGAGAGAVGASGMEVHDLDGPWHSGTLPWADIDTAGSSLADLATRPHSALTGIGANDHHNQSHVLATTSGLGGDHTTSGLTAGYVLRASGATTAAFAAIQDADLPATIVRTSRQINSGAGLTGGGNLGADLTLNVGAGVGITVNADDVALASTVAGAGLTFATGVVAVGAGLGITVNADDVALASTVAGAGLAYTSGVLSVNAGDGLVISGDNVAVAVANTGATGLTVEADAIRLTSSNNPAAAASILATDANGSLLLDTNLLYVDAPNNRVGINRTPAATLDVVATANADHTLRVTQKSGQTGRLWRVEDVSGDELIVLDSEGNLQSGNPGFYSGLTGWQISHTGNAEFNNAWIRGELHSSVFVIDEFHATGGTMMIATAAVLENDATISDAGDDAITDVRTTAFVDQTYLDYRTDSGTGSGTGITARSVENWIDISDPASGHAMVFSAGQVVRTKYFNGTSVYDLWLRINSATDMSTYYRYHVEKKSGTATTIPAGTGIVSYGEEGDGRILMTADLNYAPYLDIFTVGPDVWAGGAGAIVPHVRLGRLDGVGVPGLSGIEQYGIVAGTDLSDANEPYFYATNLGVKLYQVPLTLNDGTNDTVMLEAGGRVRFGTNVGGGWATTGFDFDPITGNLTIGNASYAGSVTIYGNLYLPGGAPIQTMTWRGAWLSGTSYAVQDAVSYGGKSWINDTAHTSEAGNAPGTGAMWDLLADQGATGPTGPTGPTGADNQDFAFLEATNAAMTGKAAGLYMTNANVGYWNGTAFGAYIDSSGNFRFGSGSGSAKLEYSASAGKLRGVDTGGTEQWYAQASDGKIYAGGGNTVLDKDGVGIVLPTLASDGFVWTNTSNMISWHDASPFGLANTKASVAAYYNSVAGANNLQLFAHGDGGTEVAQINIVANASAPGDTDEIEAAFYLASAPGIGSIAQLLATSINLIGSVTLTGTLAVSSGVVSNVALMNVRSTASFSH